MILVNFFSSFLLLSIFLSCKTSQADMFLDIVMQENASASKLIDKKIICKPPLEFKQAMGRYIKHTELTCFNDHLHSNDEKNSYKKELVYLFKNYAKFSAATLLSRLRSLHRLIVKQSLDVENEFYQHDEQLCSALLLVCAHVFFNEMRTQLLQALHEIDSLLLYWRYQQDYPVRYFFGKSPFKWVMGKKQSQEIAHNIARLERKQKELCTILGSVIAHAYRFAETEMNYENCYVWIEELLAKAECITLPLYQAPELLFDKVSMELELKLKKVARCKVDCLASVATAKKANHFVRHWIMYTALLAATGYVMNYHGKNPEVIGSAINAVRTEASKFLILLLHPLQKIYERGKLVFVAEEKTDKSKELQEKIKNKTLDEQKSLEELAAEILQEVELTSSNIAEELAKNLISLREDGINSLEDILKTVENPKDGFFYSSNYDVKVDEIRNDMKAIATKIERIKKDGKIINEADAKKYEDAISRIYLAMDDIFAKLSTNATGYESKIQLVITKYYLKAVDQVLDPIQNYTVIIDKNIIRLIQLAALIIEKFAIQAGPLLAMAEQQLKDHELTLMFTSLIPLGITAFSASKVYQWATHHNYSPIRIALADINSVLISANDYLEDHDYGKLVYLIDQLRHKAVYVKDPLAKEFLRDVAKLESRQYPTPIKREMVQNMFNKYTFLGRIAV